MKKILRVLIGLLVLVFVGGAAAFLPAFLGNAESVDGRTLAEERVITVVDGYVSCYLLRSSQDARRWLLVDACMDPEAKAIKAALAARRSSVDDVGLILLTHGHMDHIGGIKAFPRAEVRALAAEQPILSGAAPESPIGRVAGGTDTGVKLKSPLEDGERFSHEGIDVEVFAVPGHTPGSAVFLANDVLFFGDNATLADDGSLKSAPWVFSDDTAENKRSLIALYNRLSRRAGDVKSMTFGHSGSAEGMAALKSFTP